MAQQLNYLGVPVYMAGQNYYIPSLSTRDFIANEAELIKVIEGETAKDQIARFTPIILKALNRNYPEVTADALEDMLDLHTFKLAIRAVQDASGMEPVAAGE